MSFLPDDLYAEIERSMPIACVDFVLVSPDAEDDRVGLILRDSPFGRVWCHLGGRIRRGETLADALRRHSLETAGVDLLLEDDPQPRTVFPWFPPDLAPNLAPDLEAGFGQDPRKHAIGLSFVVAYEGRPEPRGEALEFGLFDRTALPSPLWPGCEELINRLLPPES